MLPEFKTERCPVFVAKVQFYSTCMLEQCKIYVATNMVSLLQFHPFIHIKQRWAKLRFVFRDQMQLNNHIKEIPDLDA